MLSMKYAKGDFQLEKHKVSLSLCVLSVRFCICFCLFLCAFSVLSLSICFCLVFCFVATYLPGRNCSRTLTFFVRFHLPTLSLSLSPPATGDKNKTNSARCAPDVALSFVLVLCYTLLHYTTHTLSLALRLVLLLLLIFIFFIFFAALQTVFVLRVFVCIVFCLVLVLISFNFFLSFLLFRSFTFFLFV